MERDSDVIDRALVFREHERWEDGVLCVIAIEDATVIESRGGVEAARTTHASEAEAEAAFVAAIRAHLARRAAAVAGVPETAPKTAPVTAPQSRAAGERAGEEHATIVIEDEKRLAKQAKLAAFFESEAAKGCRSLAIQLAGTTKYTETAGALAAVGLPPSVRQLTLCTFDTVEDFLLTEGDPRALYGRLDHVERLELQAAGLTLGEVSLPRLRELSIRAAALGDAALRALAAAEWPALERLDLWLGSPFYGGDASFEALAPILSGERFPRLRHLGLMNTVHSDAIARALPRAPILAQLETVDLSYGLLRAEGGRALVDAAAALGHLRKLRVVENDLPDEVSAALDALGPHVETGEQRPEERWARATGIEHYVPLHAGGRHLYLETIDEPVEDEPPLELELDR